MTRPTMVYLAARYSRREELCRYRDELRCLGFTVTSRWLDGSHQISDSGMPIGDDGAALVEGDDGGDSPAAARLRTHFAQEDLADIERASILIAFTEPPRSSASRGGRHVELGYELAIERKVIVVGHRENVFCWLPEVRFFHTWPGVTRHLSSREEITHVG